MQTQTTKKINRTRSLWLFQLFAVLSLSCSTEEELEISIEENVFDNHLYIENDKSKNPCAVTTKIDNIDLVQLQLSERQVEVFHPSPAVAFNLQIDSINLHTTGTNKFRTYLDEGNRSFSWSFSGKN